MQTELLNQAEDLYAQVKMILKDLSSQKSHLRITYKLEEIDYS